MRRQFLSLTLFALTLFALTGCETDTDNKIEKTRACLDKNRGAAADTCNQYLSGVNSSEADELRVRIGFEKLDLINKLSGVIGGGMTGITSALLNTTSGDARLLASQAASSGNNSLIGITNLSLAGTLCKENGTGADDTAKVKSGCATMASDPAKAADLGASLINTQNAVCATPSDKTSTDPQNLCKQVTDILGTSPTPSSAALNFSSYLTTH